MNIARLLKQTIVYWANPVNDGFGGMTFDEPVEILSRWEDRQEKFIGFDGEEHISKAVVYLHQDVALGEYVMLGTLNDLGSFKIPQDEETARRIMGFSKIPSTRNNDYLRKIWL